MKNETDNFVRTLKFTISAVLCAAMAIGVSSARAADADITGLVPTIWWDFETQPDASGLPGADKGSASITFTHEGTKTYSAGAIDGTYAIDTSKFTAYSGAGAFSTVGGAYTVSLVMNLGTNPNGITLNLRNETGERDLVVRRGSTPGSLVVGCDTWKVATRHNITTTFEDDSTYHLVSVVVGDTGISLYVDGTFVDSTTDFTPWTDTGRASRLQFGSHLSGVPSGEAKYGGCIDDLRIHDAALTPAQMKAIAAEYGLASLDGYIAVAPSGEPTVGTGSFRAPFVLILSEGDVAEAAIVYGTDAALSAPTTNVVGSALSAGAYAASLSGLASGTTYWWKLVATNGVNQSETGAASFRTLDVIVPTDYVRRVPAVLSGYAGTDTLTNFPVLVKLAAGTPAGFDYADCAEDGSDLRFAASDGTMLPHEIDTWNTNGESFVWVKIPAISGTATTFSMYYGAADPARLPPVDPRSVWTAAGHRAVWHFATNATESAQGLVASTATGTPSYENDGAVGKCWQSAGEAWLQYANDVSWSALGAGSTLTISAWAKFDSTSYDYNRILSTMSTWEQPAGYELTVQNHKNEITVGSSGRSQYQKVVSPGPMDEMVYITAVYNTDRYADLYVNGVLQVREDNQQLNAVVQPTEPMTVACVGNGGNVWNGKLDELRLHAAAESADWVKACYDTMATPTSFAVLSPVELTDPELPRFGDISASDANGTATFAVALDQPGFGGAVPTAVSVFYGTNGVDWTEIALGSTNEVGTLTGSVSGLTGNVRYLWYAVASATQGDDDKTTTSAQQSFVSRAVEPAGEYKSFKATIDWDGAPAVNVPVLMRISETVITGFNYNDVTASKFEILDADGYLLPYEIEFWNTDGESIVWVLVRDYHDGATLTVRYGTDFVNEPHLASEVWADCSGVWHMNTTSPADVSLSGNDGTAVGSPAVAAGTIGTALSLPTSSDYVSCGSALANSELASGFTVEGWANPADTSGKCPMFAKDNFISVRIDAGKIVVTTPNVLNHTAIAAPISVGTWFHWAMTFVPGTGGLCFYVNGNLVNTQDASAFKDPSGSTEMWLGRNQWNEAYTGLLDEMRLRAGIRSADWLAAEYHAMGDANALAYSTAESSDTDIPVIGAISAVDDNGSATFSVELERPACGGTEPTSVSVFYGTNGVDWTEFVIGSTNEAATLTATAPGFEAGVRYVWYAVATATSGGTPKTTTSAQQSFVARAFDPTGYYKSFTATIAYDGTPAENVPVPIRISEMEINGFSYDDVTESRFEILDAGGQLLPYEIDTWNPDGESILWTRLPVFENGATITVRYGAQFANAPLPSTNVWAGYAGVWHMSETYDGETAATGLSHDSSGNGLDATPTKGGSGNLAQMVSAPGVVGNARVNATSNTKNGNYLSVPSYDSLALGDTFAVSGWFKATTISGYPRLLSRKTAYDTNNGWEIENANGNAKAFSARGASGDAISLNTPSYDNTWIHIALVYNGKTLSAYANGASCGSGTIAAATENGKPLSFGNNSNGSEYSLPGLYDEIRMLDATPSAAWIAAEYHAMVDVPVVSSVSSSDTSAPVLGTPSVASNPDGSFTVSVEVSENTPASIVCIVGGTEVAMTTSGASLPAIYTATFSQLVTGTHVATVRATATSGTVVSSTCPTAFHVGSLTIVKQSDADEGMLAPGVFRLSRADADPTGLPALTFSVAFSGSGLAAIADPGISTATIPAGAAYVDISVSPIPNDAVNENLELVLTVSGAHVGQSSTASLTVLNASFDLAVRYVSPDGNDANSGGTPESPKKTIAAAVAAVSPIAPSRPCTVHVASGLYPISTPLVVTNAISVIGDDPDPSRTVVSNADRHGDWGVTRRVFTINHADAFVANLTMQSGYMLGSDSGGNFSVGSAGGTVSNCVIEAGDTRGNTYAAGGRLSGGLVTHTIFRKNICGSGMGNWQGSHGAVLELFGSSRAENCLLVDNPPSGSVYLSLIGDSAVMRNCTIADTVLKSTNEYCKVFTAIRINSANATVLNTVIAGVTNTIDGAACPPTGSGVANFLNGAFDGDVTGLPEGTVTGTAESFFKDYANGDYTPKAGGPLVGKGSNYEGMASVDLAGNPRKVGSKIDIGCYELRSTPLVLIVR